MKQNKRVLIAHVPYEHRGGEDVHVDLLARAYESIGFTVAYLPRIRTPHGSVLAQALKSLSQGTPTDDFDQFWRESAADFIHAHNIYPVLGPRFLNWIISRKIPMIWTVHNHRFYCTNGLALRQGKICKDCLTEKSIWRPVTRNCNDDIKKSLYYATAVWQARKENLFERATQKFIAPSPYIAQELCKLGFNEKKIVQILNPITTHSSRQDSIEYDVFYAGRLSEEKGLRTLVDAARMRPQLRFAIAGSGPLQSWLIEQAKTLNHITLLGSLDHAQVNETIAKSRICVLSSICNEILPSFVLEAFINGRYCVVPDLESTRWLTEQNRLGIPAQAGNATSLALAIDDALSRQRPEPNRVLELTKQLGLERFCSELKTVISGLFNPL